MGEFGDLLRFGVRGVGVGGLGSGDGVEGWSLGGLESRGWGGGLESGSGGGQGGVGVGSWSRGGLGSGGWSRGVGSEGLELGGGVGGVGSEGLESGGCNRGDCRGLGSGGCSWFEITLKVL